MPKTGSRPDRSVPQVAERQCEPCTACCDGWLKIEVYGHQIDRGAPCPFSTGQSCKIYQQRPQDPCREFICGWRAHNSPLPEWMRPDKAGMILLAANFSWQGHPVDVAVRVGERPKNKALEWLKSFCAERKRPLLYQAGEDWYAFGPPAFQKDMHDRMERGERPWT
jgi:hypothetical protein